MPDVESERLAYARSRSFMLATPIARAPCWQYTFALAETVSMCERLRLRYACQYVVGSSNLPRVRNELAARFLASGLDDLIFIDDDMGWSANSILRLLASRQPMIAAAGRKKVDKPNSDPNVWCAHFPAEAATHLDRDEMGAVRVLRVGTAFLKISRHVFADLIAAHPGWKRKGTPGMPPAVAAAYHRFFRFGDDEEGEDFVFCDAWRALGGEIWIDPKIHLDHVGEKAWGGAIAEIMAQMAAEQQATA